MQVLTRRLRLRTTLLLSAWLSTSIAKAEASASNDTMQYLGESYSAAHCSILAGQAGFKYFQYGGYLWNGFGWYYSLNACFGGPLSSSPSDPDPSLTAQYDIYPRAGISLEACAEDLEWSIDSVTTRPNRLRGVIEAKSSTAILKKICMVACVKTAYRTNPSQNTTPISCNGNP